MKWNGKSTSKKKIPKMTGSLRSRLAGPTASVALLRCPSNRRARQHIRPPDSTDDTAVSL